MTSETKDIADANLHKIEQGDFDSSWLDGALKDTASIDISRTDFKKVSVSKTDIAKIIQMISQTFNLERSMTIVAIILLFLRGAASNGTPGSLSVEVDGVEISKRDLMYAYEMVTRDLHLRRLAEAMAPTIGVYAEKMRLRGELAQRINTNILAKGELPLDMKEAAWCSSFSQGMPDLEQKSSPRLVALLAEDYNTRFAKKGKPRKEPPTSAGPIPKDKKGTKPSSPNPNSNFPKKATGEEKKEKKQK